MRLRILTTFLLLMAVTVQVQAQASVQQEVQSAIEKLFDGMRESDSSKVASVFTKDAIMQTVVKNQEGMVTLNNGNLEGFLKAVGTDKNEIWDERIGGYEIKVDGELASAWTPYQFYRGDNFSHCGVNSFQLMNTEEGWKIFHIVDTRRRDNCVN